MGNPNHSTIAMKQGTRKIKIKLPKVPPPIAPHPIEPISKTPYKTPSKPIKPIKNSVVKKTKNTNPLLGGAKGRPPTSSTPKKRPRTSKETLHKKLTKVKKSKKAKKSKGKQKVKKQKK